MQDGKRLPEETQFSMVPLSSVLLGGRPSAHAGSSRSSMMAPTRQDGLCSFSQHEGIDYLDTYASVLHLKNLHFLLAYAVLIGYKIHSIDVDNIFLQPLLNKDIYAR